MFNEANSKLHNWLIKNMYNHLSVFSCAVFHLVCRHVHPEAITLIIPQKVRLIERPNVMLISAVNETLLLNKPINAASMTDGSMLPMELSVTSRAGVRPLFIT